MQSGDRVVVIAEHDEWSGRRGVMTGLRADGFVLVQLDQVPWIVAFWPHDVELERIVDEKAV